MICELFLEELKKIKIKKYCCQRLFVMATSQIYKLFGYLSLHFSFNLNLLLLCSYLCCEMSLCVCVVVSVIWSGTCHMLQCRLATFAACHRRLEQWQCLVWLHLLHLHFSMFMLIGAGWQHQTPRRSWSRSLSLSLSLSARIQINQKCLFVRLLWQLPVFRSQATKTQHF